MTEKHTNLLTLIESSSSVNCPECNNHGKEENILLQNDYQFLRTVWSKHRINAIKQKGDSNISDKMDDLNKIVSILKNRINLSIKKQAYDQNANSPDQLSARQSKIMQKLNNAMMQNQQYHMKVVELEDQKSQLEQKNKKYQDQNQRLKNQQKQSIRKIQLLSKQKMELQNKLLLLNIDDTGIKRSKSRNHESYNIHSDQFNLPLSCIKNENISKSILSDRQLPFSIKYNKMSNMNCQARGSVSYQDPQSNLNMRNHKIKIENEKGNKENMTDLFETDILLDQPKQLSRVDNLRGRKILQDNKNLKNTPKNKFTRQNTRNSRMIEKNWATTITEKMRENYQKI